MTIQISVTIWTAICLLLLMFILDRLLFKPIIALMNAREEKINSARAAKDEARAAYLKKKEEALRAAEEARLKAERESAQLIEDARFKAEHRVTEQISNQQSELEAYRERLKKEHIDFSDNVNRHIDELANSFVVGFLS